MSVKSTPLNALEAEGLHALHAESVRIKERLRDAVHGAFLSRGMAIPERWKYALGEQPRLEYEVEDAPAEAPPAPEPAPAAEGGA